MLRLFKKDQVTLNRLYKQVNGDKNVLVFPISVSRPVSKTKYDEIASTRMRVGKLVEFGESDWHISICEDYTKHKSADFKNNLIVCILLSGIESNDYLCIGAHVAVPMSEFVEGNFEEVIGFTSEENLPVSSADLEKLLSK